MGLVHGPDKNVRRLHAPTARARGGLAQVFVGSYRAAGHPSYLQHGDPTHEMHSFERHLGIPPNGTIQVLVYRFRSHQYYLHVFYTHCDRFYLRTSPHLIPSKSPAAAPRAPRHRRADGAWDSGRCSFHNEAS